MAKLLEEKPAEITYTFELTRSEVDAIASVICDLVDKNRKVSLNYPREGNRVVPTKKFRKTLEDLSKMISDDHDQYDYYDWFKDVPVDSDS